MLAAELNEAREASRHAQVIRNMLKCEQWVLKRDDLLQEAERDVASTNARHMAALQRWKEFVLLLPSDIL